MKKLLILTSILTSIVFASEGKCELLRKEFVKRIPNQKVTLCNVNIKGSTRALALYFKMDKTQYVSLYKYDDGHASIYASDDPRYVDKSNCIKDSIFTQYNNTSSQIAEDLLYTKEDCEDEYWIKHHPVRYYNHVLK